MIPDNDDCSKQCEKVFEDYVDRLKHRYEGERKELIDAKVIDKSNLLGSQFA